MKNTTKLFFWVVPIVLSGYKVSFSQDFWQQTALDDTHLQSISLIDSSTGIAVGVKVTSPQYWFAIILGTTDGGRSWERLFPRTYYDSMSVLGRAFMGVSFTNANNGTAVGFLQSRVFRTNNGGATWASQSVAYGALYGVSFTDANTRTIVGDGGTVLRTTDDGATWITQSSGTTALLYGVSFTDATTGTAVGVDGTILRTTTGGVVGVEEDPNLISGLPRQFLLEQNFPNPFNPQTTFSFEIPYSSLVVFKVYNILGNEVSTLVNEVRQAGRYEVLWDASAHPSGVYFYRLVAGQFSETKKLLLLK